MARRETDAPAPGGPRGTRAAGFARWLPVLLLVALALVVYATGLHEKLSLERVIREHENLKAAVAEAGPAAVLVFIAIYVAVVALSIPGASLLTMVAGFLFGWFPGGIWTVIAATAGATVIFVIARSALGRPLRARAGPFLSRLGEGFREDALSYLLFLRLVPIFPFWLVNIAPALFDVPLRTYVLASFVGMIPGTFAYTLVGAGLDSLIAAQEAANPGCAAAGTCEIDLAALLTPTMVAALMALGVLALMPPVLKRLRRRRAGASSAGATDEGPAAGPSAREGR